VAKSGRRKAWTSYAATATAKTDQSVPVPHRLGLADVDMVDLCIGRLAIEIDNHLPSRPIASERLKQTARYMRDHMQWYRAEMHNAPLMPTPGDAKRTLQEGAELAQRLGEWLRALDFEALARLGFQIDKEHALLGGSGHIFPKRILAKVAKTVALLEASVTRATRTIEKGQTGQDSSAEDGFLRAITKAWEMATGHAFIGTKRAHDGTEIAFAVAMLKCVDPRLSDEKVTSAIRKLQPASRKIRLAKNT
jgi:hypothetical protein